MLKKLLILHRTKPN